ncbi:MAG: glycosyltransferase family 4 protein [Ignavibacteriales bacterium]|nr:glycosyltransferase family 4 protein [Ignavibacteriales bacterium]
MKKVLIITYYFPPSGGPGVQRVLKFAKYLPTFGWQPVVLTVENGDFPARDESLMAEIPSEAKVYRTKIFEPYSWYRKLTGKQANAPVDVENIPQKGKKGSLAESLAEFVRGTFFIPDARIGWLPTAVRAAADIIRKEKIDVLYSSSPPYTTAIIGRTLQRRFRLPWIAGFRDPWTGFLTSPDRWFLPKLVDRWLERSVFESANLVECAWEGIAKDFQSKYPHVNPMKCAYLPNGFDSDDYPSVSATPNDKFTVVYTGSMYGKRNPHTFLRAVEEAVREGLVELGSIRLKFIGRFGTEVRAMFEASGVRSSIETVEYIPHAESVKELLRADALLLVVDETKESTEIVPGKVFEYLGAQRPIIALAEEGAAARILRETNTGFVAGNHDIGAIKSAFVECYRNFLYHHSSVKPNGEAIKKYERRLITKRLAELLDFLYVQYESHR